MVIRFAREQDLSGVELVQRTSDGPHVQRIVVRQAEDYAERTLIRQQGENAIYRLTDFRRTVESRDEIRGDVMLRSITSRPEIADFEYRLVLAHLLNPCSSVRETWEAFMIAYKDIIWFQIRMNNIALFHERQCKEDLMCVGPYGSQV